MSGGLLDPTNQLSPVNSNNPVNQPALGSSDSGQSGGPAQQAFDPVASYASTINHQNNALIGADVEAQAQGSKSFTDNVSDIFTKGVPLTGAAIVNSFYNTAVEAGNFLGGDFQKATIENEFGPDSDTTQYYQQHSGVIEGAALAIGSLAPGLGAIKALKAAEGLGRFGEILSHSTGLLSGIRERAIAEAGEDMIGNATGTSLFGQTARLKTTALLAGALDQTVQGAVYQVATLATMKASPLTDSNTLADNLSDIKDSMLGFGVVGGLMEGAQAFSKINAGVLKQDQLTKLWESSQAKGIGNLTPGDHVVNLYAGLKAIPAPTSGLGQAKYNFNVNTTQRLIRSKLIEAADGDEELAGTMHNYLEGLNKSGQLTPDVLAQNMGQLSKIGRHGDESIASVPNDVFYVNSKIDPGNVAYASHDDLMTRIAAGDAANSRAYTLADPNYKPVIGRATDTMALPQIDNINPVTRQTPKFNGALDAYKQGVDMYVDAGGKVHVNPDTTAFTQVARPGESRILSQAEQKARDATGNLPAASKPLNAIGLTLDVATNKLFGETPLPVVGDFGKPKLSGIGQTKLIAGDKSFTYTPGSGFEPDQLDPLSANARYVAMAMRGIKEGDEIASNDLPMLEQLYREKIAGFDHEDLHTFSDTDEAIPDDAPSLLAHIADQKQQMWADMVNAGKDADEIGMKLNAPTSGMTKMFNTTDPAEIISGWDHYIQTGQQQSANIRHIRLAYDIGTTKDSEGNLLRGMQATDYRQQLAQNARSDTMAAFLNKMVGSNLAPKYMDSTKLNIPQVADLAGSTGQPNIQGAGASFLTNANAGYGTFAQQAERAGRAVNELKTARAGVINSTLLAPANALKADPAAAAEFGNFKTITQSTGEFYQTLTPQELQANGLPPNTLVLEGAISKDAKSGMRVWNPGYMPDGFVHGNTNTAVDGQRALKTYYTLGDKSMAMISANQELNNFRNSLRTDWYAAQGIQKETYNPDRAYFNPVDTRKQPYFAYVRGRAQVVGTDSSAGLITAQSADELQNKIANLSNDFEVFTNKDLKGYQQAKGDYEAERGFGKNLVNSELARKGMLNNLAPDTDGQKLVSDLFDWHARMENKLIEDHVELHNADEMAQLRAMGDRFDATATSQKGLINQVLSPGTNNPYNSYIRTAKGLSARDQSPMWMESQEALERFGSTAFNTAKSALGMANKNLLPVEEADKMSRAMGLGSPYGTALDKLQQSRNYYGGIANLPQDARLLSKFSATANTVLNGTIIRLDAFQQLIHAVTIPVMTAMEHSSATEDLKALGSVTVPGTGQQVPGFSRMMFNAVKNYFSDDSDKLLQMYKIGSNLSGDEIALEKQVRDALALPQQQIGPDAWQTKMDTALQLGSKLSGSNWTNKFIHFIASDMGRQIGEANGQSGQDLLDTIGTFTNRVLGNVPSAARATVFSGPVGTAMGLFQSYRWNMMQQLLRHVGEGDWKALAMGSGMQASIFGMSSLPGFQAMNSLIAERHGNTGGQDLYSGMTSMLGKSAGDYLLYGSLSGLTNTALYSRGDLNPRSAAILPVNPRQFPSVQAGIRIYQTLAQLEQNLSTQGGNVPASLLMAAEHNGLSRPLTGLATMMQGYSTTPNGQLVSTNPGMSDLFSIASMSRLAGGRPLDEGVAMDALYRYNSLKTLDRARLDELGTSAKTALHGTDPDAAIQASQSMLANYVKAGGNQANFGQWFLQQAKTANIATVNKTMESFHDPHVQGLQETMGGQPLPDFRNGLASRQSGQPEQ